MLHYITVTLGLSVIEVRAHVISGELLKQYRGRNGILGLKHHKSLPFLTLVAPIVLKCPIVSRTALNQQLMNLNEVFASISPLTSEKMHVHGPYPLFN